MPIPPLPYRYSPLPERPPLRWPDGARLALWVIPNVEVFPVDEPIGRAGPQVPNVPAFAARDYGARVGVWRIAEVLQKHGLRATLALNSEVCDAYPQIVKAGVELGWEFMGHGQANTRRLLGLTPEEEATVIADVTTRIAEATGRRPDGWLSPGLTESFSTVDLLAANGYRYVADWINDDQPYRMEVGGHTLISVPYTMEANDIPAYERQCLTPEGFAALIGRQFDVLYREGETSGRAMAIALHPYLTGLPHRIDALDQALGYILSHEHVWPTTGGEIAAWYARQESGIGSQETGSSSPSDS
jgi:peptidoglycan/xylan/chitin deacetylase (PgdA/CDA1 family)